MVNKKELANRVAEKMGSTKKLAEQNVDILLEVIQETLGNGEDVKISGWGSWECRKRNQRKGRNPKTNEEIIIPATKTIRFKMGKLLRDAVEGVG